MSFKLGRTLTRGLLCALGLFVGCFGISDAAVIKDWPSGAVHMVVGFPAGSAPDLHARIIAEPLSRALNRPVVVENRPGASGNIGANAVAKATDGLTIGLLSSGSLTSSSFLYEKLPYDGTKDFAPIALVASSPLVWVTTPRLLDGSQDFVSEAHKARGSWFYGSIGAGSGSHLAMELIKRAFGIDAVHVPFSGGPAVVSGLLGGQIQMALLPASTVLPMIRAGKLVGVGVTSAQRSSVAPQLRSMRELGAPELDLQVWNAVMGPISMPTAHRNLLRTEIGRILESPEIAEKLKNIGWLSGNADSDLLTARIKTEKSLYEKLIRENKIKVD
jgi:tripartite-type tricarboxylate transporter receptor subunit TctC